MIELRIKECCKAHNILVSELSRKMGYEQVTSLNQLLRRRKIGLDKLEQMADIIGCKVSELLEVDSSPSGDDFASYIRYHGIHYTADTLDDFFKQVDELRAITRR